MKIRDILAEDKPTLSFEVFPPKTEDAYETVEKAAKEIAGLKPSFMSVTYGAGGGTSDYTVGIASDLQRKYGVTPLAHLTCVSSTREKVHSVLDQLKAEGKKVGIICTEESRAMYPEGNLEVIGSREHEETVAHNLFAVLRDFDARKVDCIFSESFSKDQLGQAIMNRLCKAAGYHIVNV